LLGVAAQLCAVFASNGVTGGTRCDLFRAKVGAAYKPRHTFVETFLQSVDVFYRSRESKMWCHQAYDLGTLEWNWCDDLPKPKEQVVGGGYRNNEKQCEKGKCLATELFETRNGEPIEARHTSSAIDGKSLFGNRCSAALTVHVVLGGTTRRLTRIRPNFSI